MKMSGVLERSEWMDFPSSGGGPRGRGARRLTPIRYPHPQPYGESKTPHCRDDGQGAIHSYLRHEFRNDSSGVSKSESDAGEPAGRSAPGRAWPAAAKKQEGRPQGGTTATHSPSRGRTPRHSRDRASRAPDGAGGMTRDAPKVTSRRHQWRRFDARACRHRHRDGQSFPGARLAKPRISSRRPR